MQPAGVRAARPRPAAAGRPGLPESPARRPALPSPPRAAPGVRKPAARGGGVSGERGRRPEEPGSKCVPREGGSARYAAGQRLLRRSDPGSGGAAVGEVVIPAVAVMDPAGLGLCSPVGWVGVESRRL